MISIRIARNKAIRHISRRYNSSASDKLFADAAREEAEQASAPQQQSSKIPFLESQNENWTGDERIQDAVLRMLVDKYKPLRTGAIQSADQKLKNKPPVVKLDPIEFPKPPSGSWAAETLIPSKEGHRPWHTEFKVPSHVTSSIKLANIPPPTKLSFPATTNGLNNRNKKAAEKRTQMAGRLNRARESTLDYRLGIRRAEAVGGVVNPVSIKGWAGLVEDRIERARLNGLFKTVKGRGEPIKRMIEESNPFIAREEFLMNRIVQRNGAVPPWVELQGELDSALSSFREVLRQSYVRRAIRNLTTNYPPPLLARFTLADIRSLRDGEWESREESYHDTAIEEVNSLVRKYNGIAPYAVRRPYYMRSAELEKCYEDCAEEIYQSLQERVTSIGATTKVSNGEDRLPLMEVARLPKLKELIQLWIKEVRFVVDNLTSRYRQ